jgi:hypothetical protein
VSVHGWADWPDEDGWPWAAATWSALSNTDHMHEKHPLGLYRSSQQDSWATTWAETSMLPRTPPFGAQQRETVEPFELFVRIHMLIVMVHAMEVSAQPDSRSTGVRWEQLYPTHLPNPLLALGIDESLWPSLQNIPVLEANPMAIRWCLANSARYEAASKLTGLMYHVDDKPTRHKHEEAAHAWAQYLAYMFQGNFTRNDGCLAGASVYIMKLLGSTVQCEEAGVDTTNTQELRTQLMTVLSLQQWAEPQRMSLLWFRTYLPEPNVETRLAEYATKLTTEAAGQQFYEWSLDNPAPCPDEARSATSIAHLKKLSQGEPTPPIRASDVYWRSASMWSSKLLDTQWMVLHLVVCPATRELCKATAGTSHDTLHQLFETLDKADPGVAAAKTRAAEMCARRAQGTQEAAVDRGRLSEWQVFEEVHADGICEGNVLWGNAAKFDASQAKEKLGMYMLGNNGNHVLGPCKFGVECAEWNNIQHKPLSQCVKCNTWFHGSCASILTTLGTGPMEPSKGCCSLMCEDPDNGKMLADAKQAAEQVGASTSVQNARTPGGEAHKEARTTRSSVNSPAKSKGKGLGSDKNKPVARGKRCIHDEMLGADMPCLSAEGCAQYPCANALHKHRAEVKQAEWLPRHASPRQGLFATADLPKGSYVADFGPFRVLPPVKPKQLDEGGSAGKKQHAWRFEVNLPTVLGAVSRSIVPKRGWQGKYHGAKANHTCCPVHQNAKYVSSECSQYVYVCLTKPVRCGAEILVAYNTGAFFKNHCCACCACTGKCP